MAHWAQSVGTRRRLTAQGMLPRRLRSCAEPTGSASRREDPRAETVPAVSSFATTPWCAQLNNGRFERPEWQGTGCVVSRVCSHDKSRVLVLAVSGRGLTPIEAARLAGVTGPPVVQGL